MKAKPIKGISPEEIRAELMTSKVNGLIPSLISAEIEVVSIKNLGTTFII